MTVLNTRGAFLLNASNGPVSDALGAVLTAPAGMARFLTDDRAVLQDLRQNLATVRIFDLPAQTFDALPPAGYGPANALVAGGGVWAAWGPHGYFDSRGHTEPTWYPLAADAVTGDILVAIHYLALGLWNGTTLTPIYTGPLQGYLNASVDAGQVIASLPDNTLLYWPPQPTWPTMRAFINYTVRDGWLVGWHTGWNGLALWHLAAGSSVCYLLRQNANAYAASVVQLPSGLIRVVASRGAGQLPGEALVYDVDDVAHTVNTTQPAVRVDVFGAVDAPPAQTPPPVTIPDFAPAPIACVPFDWYAINPAAPRIVGPGESADGDIRYVLHTAGHDLIAPAVAWATRVGARVLGYHDAPVCDPSVVPREADVVGIQCYPIGGLAAAKTRIQISITRVRAAGRPFALVTPAYTGSEAWPLQDVLDLSVWCWDLAATAGADVLPFGIIRPPQYAALVTMVQRMLAAAKEPDMPTPIPDPNDPKFIKAVNDIGAAAEVDSPGIAPFINEVAGDYVRAGRLATEVELKAAALERMDLIRVYGDNAGRQLSINAILGAVYLRR